MKPLGIYVHIPFCLKKCKYCDFLSFSDKYSFVAEYFRALAEELKRYVFLSKDYLVDTVFFGGGTPSSVDSPYICIFMRMLKEQFHISKTAEISIEMNPGTVTDKKLSDYISSGINRFSLGVQTFDEISLRRIGRIHTADQVFQTIQMFRSLGIENYNVDMMHALPSQTFNDLCKDLEILVSLNPSHISYYSLIVEEGTEFESIYHSNPEVFPDEEEDRRMSHYISDFLSCHGYQQYEISNYSKKAMNCKHNLKYWTLKEYLGLGLGSSSFIKGIRWQNTSNWKSYLSLQMKKKNMINIIRELQPLTPQEQMEDFCIFSLRMTEGIDRKRFHNLFNHKIEDIYGEVIAELVQERLALQTDDFIRLTGRGFDLANICELKFLL